MFTWSSAHCAPRAPSSPGLEARCWQAGSLRLISGLEDSYPYFAALYDLQGAAHIAFDPGKHFCTRDPSLHPPVLGSSSCWGFFRRIYCLALILCCFFCTGLPNAMMALISVLPSPSLLQLQDCTHCLTEGCFGNLWNRSTQRYQVVSSLSVKVNSRPCTKGPCSTG